MKRTMAGGRAGELPWQHIHIVGIGGTGLSAIARVLLEMGYHVSGCDREESSKAHALRSLGADVRIGHERTHVAAADALLVTSAIKNGHEEVKAAMERGVPVLRRRDFLSHLLRGREVLAVAGTHGKTTTTAMIVHMLRSAGYWPGYIVGADVPRWGNAAAGSHPTFVIEADEYDYMFWGLAPQVAVVTNVEWDHVDCFPKRETYRDAFVGFARQSRHLVVCADDAGAMDVAARAGIPVTTYGLQSQAAWSARVDGVNPQGGYSFQPLRDGMPVGETVHLRVPGLHNVYNALAALAALEAAGFAVSDLAVHLATYEGAERRFRVLGSPREITVVDDYAHHPTEVRTTLAAARSAYPRRRIWAVFQPHTYSRTRAFLPQWREAFADADVVAVMDIYAARETDTLGLSGEKVANEIRHPRVYHTGDVQDTVAFLLQRAQPGDVIITLGAGTSVQVARGVFDGLRGGTRVEIPRRHIARWRQILGEDTLAEHVPLAEYTTLRVGGPADVLAMPTRSERLAALVADAHAHGVPVTILGGGSNVLVLDGGIRGLVVLNRCRRTRVFTDEDGEPRAWAEAGASLAGLARALIREGLDGLTWAVSIPGTVGGAVVGNAGAHGGAIADVLESATLLFEDGSTREVPASDLAYAYRTSRLKEARERGEPFPVVLAATFRLRRVDPHALRARADEFLAHRRRTQPVEASAGSIFRNPSGDYAGRLIDVAGLKGARVGGAMISPLHGNFIVNVGGARARDVLALIRLARERVREQFGVDLETEILILGEDREERLPRKG